MFTYDLTTALGKLRLHIGDTVEGQGVRPDGSNFQDEELQTFLTLEGSVEKAAARAFEVLAAEYARFVDITVGPRKEALGTIADHYRRLAELYRRQYGGQGGVITAPVIRVSADRESCTTPVAPLCQGEGQYSE